MVEIPAFKPTLLGSLPLNLIRHLAHYPTLLSRSLNLRTRTTALNPKFPQRHLSHNCTLLTLYLTRPLSFNPMLLSRCPTLCPTLLSSIHALRPTPNNSFLPHRSAPLPSHLQSHKMDPLKCPESERDPLHLLHLSW